MSTLPGELAAWLGRAQVTARIQPEIEAIDLMPGALQERHKNGTDVAAIASNKDPHDTLLTSQRERPGTAGRHVADQVTAPVIHATAQSSQHKT